MKEIFLNFYNRFIILTKYKWSKLIKEIYPKENALILKEEETKEIEEGLKAYIVLIVLLNIFSLLLQIVMYYKTHELLGTFSKIFGISVQDVFLVNIPSIIWGIVFSILLPLVYLIYLKNTKTKEQQSVISFIVASISFIIIVGSFIEIINNLTTLFISPVLTLICMFINFGIILSILSVFKGSIDFCHRAFLSEEKTEEIKIVDNTSIKINEEEKKES